MAESLERQSMNQTDTGDHDRALSELSAKDARSFEVDQALQRIIYGACSCELTGRRIPAARLRAVPWTRVPKWQRRERSSSFLL